MTHIKQFTYDGDPSTSTLNEVRYRIGDTIRANVMFDDREILFQITQTPNPRMAGAELLDVKSRQFARMADERVGDVSKAFSKVADQMKTCAKELRSDALKRARPFFGGLSISGKRALAEDTNAVQPQFSIGQTDNPYAAQLNQDWANLIGLVGSGV